MTTTTTATTLAPPLAILAELTHRCPLSCPYCSNPIALAPRHAELDTDAWRRVFDEAAALGVLQLHLSGGEPATRRDLEALVAHAAARGLYTNLITSGLLLDERRVAALAGAGLDHVQLSVQDIDAEGADAIAGLRGAHAHKLAVAAWLGAAGLPLTLNVVLHRANVAHVEALLELALRLGARRVELAHAIEHGWARHNRAALEVSPDELARVREIVDAARARLVGVLAIDHVLPDRAARFPKACTGGWGQRFLVISPSGATLPCHAAETIPGLRFDRVGDRPLAEIWRHGEALARFRGTAWMPEPCRSCERREIDLGGCRCQALAETGDAASVDPACERSPHHARYGAPPPRLLPVVPRGGFRHVS